ncbi:MAG: NAD(P)H-dependent oxidoreductase subunit E [Negativicutes bacterium]|nr:NAD(P)H-dependent oxidoreductase subunit E [Negativicutes bacterium]
MVCNCMQSKFSELDQYIGTLSISNKGSALIPVLHHAQSLFGYLPQDVQSHIAERLDISTAKVYGVVSFYTFFTMVPRGQSNINVCLGTACFVGGAEAVLKEFENQLQIKSGETTPDFKFSITPVRCVGACSLAPVVMINNKVYGHVKPEDVAQILSEYSQIEGGV